MDLVEFHRIQGKEGWTSLCVRRNLVFQTSIPPFLILISPIPPPLSTFEYLDIPIIYTMTAPKQHKQRYYYIFWSIATLSVVIGQINVFNSYNRLSENLEIILIEQAREKINKASN